MMNLSGLLGWALFFPVLYLSILCHELGHAICARLSGFVVTACGVGTGKPIVVVRLWSISFYLAWEGILQGLTFYASPQLFAKRGPTAFTLAGGCLAHLLLILLGLWMWFIVPQYRLFWGGWIGLNALFLLINLLPLSVQVGMVTLQSDGSQILRTLRFGSPATPAPVVIGIARQFRPLWEAIGDTQGLYLFLASAAQSWIELGQHQRAAQVLEETEQLSVQVHPSFVGQRDVLRGIVAEDPDQAEALLDGAEQGFEETQHPVGLLYVRWGRAQRALQRGDAAQAMTILEQLLQTPLVRAAPALEVPLLVSVLTAYVQLGKGKQAVSTWRRFRSLPAWQRSPVESMWCYLDLGRLAQRAGKRRLACRLYRLTLRCARQIHEALGHPEDREPFQLGCQPWLREVQTYFQRVRLHQAAAQLDAFFPTEEQITEHRAQQQRDNDRRFLRQGLWMSAVNLVFLASVLTLEYFLGPLLAPRLRLNWLLGDTGLRPPSLGAVLSLLLIPALVLSLVHGLIAGLVGRWVPVLRVHAGAIQMWLAFSPWLLLGLAFLLSLASRYAVGN